MFNLASLAASLAAAVTGTATPETDAAGCRFGYTHSAGDGSTWPTANRAPRRPLRVFVVRVLGFASGEVYRAEISATDWRDAVRALRRRAGNRPIPVGFDGSASVFPWRTFRGDGPGIRGHAYSADGYAVGVVCVRRADFRPIRTTRKGGAA